MSKEFDLGLAHLNLSQKPAGVTKRDEIRDKGDCDIIE